MACSIRDFEITGEWEEMVVNGSKVELASAVTKGRKLPGVVYKVDGIFKGFTGSKDAVIYWVSREK